VPEKQIKRDPLETFNLEFNIEERITIALQNVAQAGQLDGLLSERAGNVVAPNLRIVTNHRLSILGEAHIEFQAVATVGQGLVEGGERVLGKRLDGAGAAVAEEKRAAHNDSVNDAINDASSRNDLIKIEVSNWLAGVRRFFGLLHGFLKLLLEQIRSVSLSFDRLLEDRFAASVLLAHGLGRRLHVVKHFRLYRRGVSDDGARLHVDLQHRAAARAGYFEIRWILRH